MPPSLHAVLNASSAHRWLACTPSARLSEKFDRHFGRQESTYAAEGTKAHALAEIKVRLAIYKADGMTATKLSHLPKAEREAYQGINDYRYKKLRAELGEIPSDMEHATDSYCDIVMEKLLRARDQDAGAQIFLEQRLDYSAWVPSGFGTGDCIIVSDALLEILDYKHGKGLPVAAEDNPQTQLYALGAIHRFGVMFDFPSVRMTIIQPRLENVSEATRTVGQLLKWGDDIRPTAEQAWRGGGDFNPGEHCRFCSAKAVCAARVSAALKLFGYGMEQPGTLTDEQIADILPYLDDAQAWITDIRDYATRQALHGGVRFRGYKLVLGKRPNRQWSDPEEAEAVLLRAGYPSEAVHETKLKPVGQIEKQLGKTAFQALLGELVSQGEGKPTLAPVADSRLEYSAAETVFGDLIDEATKTE